MKFREYLKKTLIPEWSSQYLDYEKLSDILDQLVEIYALHSTKKETTTKTSNFTSLLQGGPDDFNNNRTRSNRTRDAIPDDEEDDSHSGSQENDHRLSTITDPMPSQQQPIFQPIKTILKINTDVNKNNTMSQIEFSRDNMKDHSIEPDPIIASEINIEKILEPNLVSKLPKFENDFIRSIEERFTLLLDREIVKISTFYSQRYLYFASQMNELLKNIQHVYSVEKTLTKKKKKKK